MSDSPIVIETGSRPVDSCVIWLHGLGADGHDFVPIVPELDLSPDFNIRFVFPHASMMPVTINQGFMMRAWYDIKSVDIATEPDEMNIRNSAEQVNTWVEEQITAGIASHRIVLAGFSQGGVIALHAGLRQQHVLAGIMVLSSYLAMPQKLAAEKNAMNQNIPLFLAHGGIDQVIPISLAYTMRGQLEKAGYQPEWHEYEDMPHSVSRDEIIHISTWLHRVLIL